MVVETLSVTTAFVEIFTVSLVPGVAPPQFVHVPAVFQFPVVVEVQTNAAASRGAKTEAAAKIPIPKHQIPTNFKTLIPKIDIFFSLPSTPPKTSPPTEVVP
jgi:hypothetical protein